ncbi:NADPH:quinone reductase-like Zn-dependent oxidoreductase [Amphibacillus cookii]|nr:NADPH:quinone reductase-like Zn-dependent oxidoreductase [Amphibacillus cookii]
MKAYVHQDSNLQFANLTKPVLADGEVLIKMKSVGLNRRDLMIPSRRGENTEPLVMGSDGAGVVEEVANHVTRFKKGDAVIVNPGMGWITNDETSPDTLQIVGYPDHGTFAEYYVVDAEYIEPKPDHLNWEEAGVLTLAALTAFRALFTKGQVKPNETVFIPGAGSGVATYLIQFAKMIGARVIVTSRSQVKLNQAIELGADKGIGSN